MNKRQLIREQRKNEIIIKRVGEDLCSIREMLRDSFITPESSALMAAMVTVKALLPYIKTRGP